MKPQKNIQKECDEEVKCTQLPYNPQQTAKVQNSTLYIRYKKWLKDNGVIIDPRLRYPTYFGAAETGVVGVSAQKAIEKKKAIIAVPYNLLITVDKVKEDMDLFEIIKENVNYFKSDDDAALKLLILYVSSELVRGEKSFYYPYFAISTEEYLSSWGNKSMLMIEQKNVISSMKDHKQEMELEFINFLRIFRRYEKVFPQNLSNTQFKAIFQKAYIFITTRAFGWSLPSISLIPLADSFNHSNIRYVNHFLLNTYQEIKPYPQITQKSNGYKKYGKEVNLALLKDQHLNLKQEQLAELRKQKKSKPLKFVQKHADLLIQSQKLLGIQSTKLNPKNKSEIRNRQYHILHQQYKAGIHKLKNLHFYESSCDQDNDTDQDEVFDREMQREKFQIYDQQRVIDQGNKKKEVSKLWKLYLENQSQEQSEEEQNQNNKDLNNQKKKMENTKLKQELKEKLLKENDSSQVQSEDTDEEDQEIWDWTYNANHKNTYFIMSTKQIIRQNQQLYNFYGRRSNKFLLTAYNFVMQDNIYDSYWLNLRLDPKLTVKSIAKLINFDKKEQGVKSKPFKLKRYVVSQDLINVCRSYVVLWNKLQKNQPRLTIPFDREVQTKTLELYGDIIKQLLNDYSTSIEQDQELEQESEKMKYEERTAIILRKEHKKILKGQQILINKCVQWLKKWQPKNIQKIDQSQMKWVKRIKSYLISLEQTRTL